MPTKQPTPDPDTVRLTCGCRVCHVPIGEYCLRVARQGRAAVIRHRNHQVRVADAKRLLKAANRG